MRRDVVNKKFAVDQFSPLNDVRLAVGLVDQHDAARLDRPTNEPMLFFCECHEANLACRVDLGKGKRYI